MPRPKSFLPQLIVDQAQRSHTCRQNDGHTIARGEARLTVKDGREVLRYCPDCAIRFLEADLEEIRAVVRQLRSASTGSPESS